MKETPEIGVGTVYRGGRGNAAARRILRTTL
ncbi:hypothetical protein LMIY3S_04788 [Labrys miyagiensis]